MEIEYLIVWINVQIYLEIQPIDVLNIILKIVLFILVVVMERLIMEKHVETVHKMCEYVVEMEFWIDEKIVKRVRQILLVVNCVEMERQMNERIVRTVQQMYESVQHTVGMERQKKQKIVGIVRKMQKIVGIVRKMCENVVQHVEMERQRSEKIVRIVRRM